MSVCFIKCLLFLKISQNCKTIFYKTFSRNLACFAIKVSKTFQELLACFALKVYKTFHKILACLPMVDFKIVCKMLVNQDQPLEGLFCLLYPSKHGSLGFNRAGGRTWVHCWDFGIHKFLK